MTTAKVAMKSGDYEKALANLQKELEKNPKNGEAYILLAELKTIKGDILGAITLMDQAEPLVANDPILKDKPTQFKFQLFKQYVEMGQNAFNDYNQSNNKNKLYDAANFYTFAVALRPNFFEGYRRIGLAYEITGKQNQAMEAYLKYMEVIQPSIDIAILNNIYVGATTKSLIQKIGKPTFIRGNKINDTDSTILEKHTVEGNDLFIFSISKNGGEPTVVSWSYNPPKNILEVERQIVPDAITQPISSLATIYYHKKDKDNSLKYFKIVNSIDPLDENANSAIVTLYQELGNLEEAIKTINENVKRDPQNPLFIAQLGDVYMNQGDYDNAILQYEKALSIRPDFADVLRNIAPCYGNKAAKIQATQNELIAAKKMKAPGDTNAYFPLLRKAADYFNRVLETNSYSKDADVMGDLCSIYLALMPAEKALFEATLARYEALEKDIPEEKLEQYYFRLLKIYGEIRSPKYNELEEKINKLIN
jgi:tetratricopeptide (TPR) repeat protein